ncbi:WYL domain-containing protein [Candidatus Stoquefichus massiliensis]|uniref:WYL domain-containing protein n=1 Tax=Candidatus Stoquefichus massiliensis TaxID=1470350 RepID=UPI00048181C6|nr:WYL domain-containing protein [Candidatus Stoquefichus massiliensis]
MKRNKDSQSFIKFLAVVDIIIKNSDEKHALTVKDIQEKIYALQYDFSIDYRLIKKYVQYYNEYYEDTVIACYHQGRNDYYYFINTSLDTMEAKAIVDLVYSSDFFTLKTKENYKKRIQDMFSVHYQAYFNKKLNLHIVKNENDQVFYKELETITRAIHEKKKISFIYQKPSLNHDIKLKRVELAPIDTCFSNNEYYLLCQGARNPNDCLLYRLDYIKDVEIIKDSSFFYDEYQLQCFHEKLKNTTYMYGEGNLETIELDFDQSIYSNMIDKFGKDIKPYDIGNQIYRVQVKHIINSTFYSWIIGFGGKIQISGNQEQIQRFKNFLNQHFINHDK